MTQTLDIIIPVYNACQELQACVESVLNKTTGEYTLTLINDASPEADIVTYFKQLAKQNHPQVTLLHNEQNLGFVATVNRGMQLSQNNVVLLNSDTQVTSGWLDSLRHCAASNEQIGTITPFSNNAEICSFPLFCQDNPIPDNPELIAQALQATAVPIYPELPTGVGFCFYIRRTLLDKIGYFDEQAFGRGYGEENDFCQRAILAGYKNVLCGDAYVIHTGGCSFSDTKQALIEKNMQVLLSKHPDYLDSVHEFIQKDPIQPIRQAAILQLAKLAQADKPGILHVLHSMGGGARKYVDDLASLTQKQFRHYRLIAAGDLWIIQALTPEGASDSFEFKYQTGEIWTQLLEDICAWLGIDFCHIHQISEGRLGLLAAFAHASIPYGVSLHDFDMATPSMKALFNTDQNHGIEYCPQCLEAETTTEPATLAEWNALHEPLLANARFIIAPTRWTGTVYQRCYPDIKLKILPNVHQLDSSETAGLRCFLMPSDGIAHIAVVGAIGPIKGSRRFEQLVEQTRAKKLPIRWVLIGYTDQQSEPYQSDDCVLTIQGAYQPSDLKRLLQHYDIALTVFPSSGPETFCYALSEVWTNATPVLVPPVGALKERVEDSGAGWIMESWLDTNNILDQITHIVSSQSKANYKTVSQAASKLSDHVEHKDSLSSIIKLYQSFVSQSTITISKPFATKVYQAAAKNWDNLQSHTTEESLNSSANKGRLMRWKKRLTGLTQKQFS